ncbi:UDP-glycosyltransferase 90A1-like [Diospyros lotus]|uniref:UDP-glycosyltransferase 90A1-like n=1 Tax=Diospyros lotus TaxID=55363 RepID=UPI002250E3F7|nr:UDP-glycosyltransferase 90A1-like [Diospyros lotus]
MDSSACAFPETHVVLFPFMSKGHTVPILDLARLLIGRCRGTAVTIFTTPANRAFISDSLSDVVTAPSVVELPFPSHIAGVPAGVESTDKLPSMSHFLPFVTATKLMRPSFEEALGRLNNVSFIVSDLFLGWTVESASKLGIPRLVFDGMSNYARTVCQVVGENSLLAGPQSNDELFTVTYFPWIRLTRNDFDEPFNLPDPTGPHLDFIIEQIIANSRSYCHIANSFYELEPLYVDYWNRHCEPKVWCIGPWCLVEPQRLGLEAQSKKPKWLQWLDQKAASGKSVLYVAFGTQAEISSQQLREIAIGLEKSEANFLWVVRKGGSGSDVEDGFEERVKERGMVVREWVDQRKVLSHDSVKGFLSHCGWNSVVESICAKVPVLAWPMMAEQHLNARMVTEDIRVGLRMETADGSARGFVKWEAVEKMVRELMEGEGGKEVRRNAEALGGAAAEAMAEGGSSWEAWDRLFDEIGAARADSC